MRSNSIDQLTIREYPVLLWVISLLDLVGAVYFYRSLPGEWIIPAILLVLFLLVFSFASILVIKADHLSRILTISRNTLFHHSSRKIPVSDIASIQVERSSSRSTSPAYRIVVVTKSNKIIPFSSVYSSGLWSKEAKAKRLREFLGVGGAEMSLGGMLKLASSLEQAPFQQEQESITGSEAEEHITAGVHWKLETKTFSGTPISRWFSPDFKWDGNFLYLAQKMQGQGTQTSLMYALGRTVSKTSLSIFGFSPDLTPGLDFVEALTPLNSRLEPHFFAFTNNGAGISQILNPWVVQPLASWVEKYPLKKGSNDQLAILFSPQGLFIAMLGLINAEFLEELANLGAELVKAQGEMSQW